MRTATKIPFMYSFQFPHSCVYERFIYSQDRATYILQQNRHIGSCECINRSQTHECENRDCGRAIPFLGIFVLNVRYWFFAVRQESPWSLSGYITILSAPAHLSVHKVLFITKNFFIWLFIKLTFSTITVTVLNSKRFVLIGGCFFHNLDSWNVFSAFLNWYVSSGRNGF